MENKNSITVDEAVIQWLTGIILQAFPQWPFPDDSAHIDRIWRAGIEHGVLALCSYKLQNIPTENVIPIDFRNRLKDFERQTAIAELRRLAEIKAVLAHLDGQNIRPLLLKGTPLAYSLYPEPYLRSRCDTDLLFKDKDSAEQAWQLVEQRGYRRPAAVTGNFITHEFSCSKTDKSGLSHSLDFHWKISNNQFFARTFSFNELLPSSIAVPALDYGYTLCPVHALLQACMHRIAHAADNNADRLIWLYDIHLLAQSLSPIDWQLFSSLARKKQICTACLEGLQVSVQYFGSSIPEKVLIELADSAPMEYLSQSKMASRGKKDLANLQALDSWQDRIQLIREHLFPSPSYMFEKYHTNNRLILPWLYLVRICKGIPKLFR